MTKVTGIDIGRAWIHLVEVDGSARKYTVSKVCSIPRDPSSKDAGADLARAFDESEAVRNRALLAVPGKHCTFRNLNIPFKGIDAIRKVLKFEAEAVIHSHAIDDIIVDGVPVHEGEESTEIFMAACPKSFLLEGMDALKQASVDVEVFDLDVTLLVNAAASLGHFKSEPSQEGEGEGDGDGGEDQENGSKQAEDDKEAQAGQIQVIIGLGAGSTTLILVKDGRLHTARVLRWGVDHLIRSLARSCSLEPAIAGASLDRFLGLEVPTLVLDSGDHAVVDHTVVEEGEKDAESSEPAASEGVSGEDPAAWVELEPAMIQAEIRSLTQAVVRELTRLLAGSKGVGDPTKLLVSGGGGLLPGFMDILEEESGVRVEALDLLGCCQDVTPEIGELEPQLDLALAAALAGLGATETSMNFRGEELAYKRKFEKLKFPLATLTLAAAIALFFMNILNVRALNEIERSMGVWIENPRFKDSKRKAPPGYASSRGLLKHWVYNARSRDKYHSNSRVGKVLPGKRQRKALYEKLQAAGRFDRITTLRTFLRNQKTAEGKATGYFPEIKLESGVAVWQAFMEAIMAADQDLELKRFIVTNLDLHLGTSKKSRTFKFTVAFEGREEFRQQNAIFEKHMKNALGKGSSGNGSPFEKVEFTFGRILEEGIYKGLYSYVFTLKPKFDVFQPLNPGK